MLDHDVRKLSHEECRRLLAPGGLGRVAVSVAALPAIFPVPFAVVEDDVVLRAPEGSTLARALLGNVVAFEVDGVDNTKPSGWSVLVVGLATAVEERRIHDEAARRLEAWPSPDSVIHVRIPTAHISGRTFGRGGTSFGTESANATGSGAEPAVRR